MYNEDHCIKKAQQLSEPCAINSSFDYVILRIIKERTEFRYEPRVKNALKAIKPNTVSSKSFYYQFTNTKDQPRALSFK